MISVRKKGTDDKASITLGAMKVGSEGYLPRDLIDTAGANDFAALLDDKLVKKADGTVLVKRLAREWWQVKMSGRWEELQVGSPEA